MIGDKMKIKKSELIKLIEERLNKYFPLFEGVAQKHSENIRKEMRENIINFFDKKQ
jgi:hypothetical protein